VSFLQKTYNVLNLKLPEKIYLRYFFVSLICTLLCIWSVIFTGFIGDDAYNSQIKGVLITENLSVFERYFRETKGWILGAGRFFPLHWYPVYFYNVIQSELILKCVVILVISIGLTALGLIVLEITASERIGLVSIALAPIFFQLRAWHDPILSFTFLIPLLFLCFALSFLFFLYYLKIAKKKFIFISSLFHLLGLLIYEATYLFFLVYFVIGAYKTNSLSLGFKRSAPIIFISGLVIAIAIILRTDINPFFSSTYPGAELSVNFSKNIKAFFIQFTAGLPLTYFLTDHTLYLRQVSFVTIAKAGVLTVLIYALISKLRAPEIKGVGSIAITGISLATAPAVVIALSGWYKELEVAGFGYGYIPVYIQYIGCSLIFLAILLRLIMGLGATKKKWFCVGISAFVFGVATLHIGSNDFVAESTSPFYKYPRKILSDGLVAFSKIPTLSEEMVILREPRYPYDQGWFFSQVMGKKTEVKELNSINFDNRELFRREALGKITKYTPVNKNFWVVSYNSTSSSDGYFLIGAAKHFYADTSSNYVFSMTAETLYILNRESQQLEQVRAQGIDLAKVLRLQGLVLGIPLHESFENGAYDLDGLGLLWEGTHTLDGSIKENIRWSLGESRLTIHNYSGKKKHIRLEFSVATGYPRPSAFRILDETAVITETLISSDPKVITLDLVVESQTPKNITFNSAEIRYPNSDPRAMVFGFKNLNYRILK
jgi:hypothetical protein